MEIKRQIADYKSGQEVNLDEFFTPTFMQEHTQFESFERFREQCPQNPKTEKELTNIPERELNSYVKNTTEFESWQTMQDQAAQEEIISHLTF